MELILYHGSEMIVIEPSLSKSKAYNDYGRGFYCTEDEELSKEWACKRGSNGFSNKYVLELDGLNVVDLTDSSKYSTLEWISILIRNRTFTIPIGSISEKSRDYLIERHSLDLSNVDVIIGYRADDSYFSYAQSFLDNSMSLESLESAVMLGDLGKQVVLISEEAISRLRFIDSTSVDNRVYGPLYSKRDSNARDQLKKLKGRARNGKFILQIMEEGL